MGRRGWSRLLLRGAGLHADERRLAGLLFVYFFLITTPHTIIKALRTSDLIAKMGVGAVPVAYLLAAAVTGLVVLLQARLQTRLSLRAMIMSGLLFFAVSGLGLQAVLLTDFGRRSYTLLPYVYWVWASVLIVVLMTHYWMLVNMIFDPRQAKRLVGFLGSGGILGGITGGLAAGFLAKAGLAVILLPLACGLLVACAFVVRRLAGQLERRPRPETVNRAAAKDRSAAKAGFKSGFESVRKSRYLRLIAVIVASAVVVSVFIEFQFLSALSDAYWNEQGLQTFLGFFLAALTFVAFVLNLLLTAGILRRILTVAVLVTPVALLLGSAAFLLLPFSLIPAAALKIGDGSLTFSLNQSVREILYIPVDADLKAKAKPFIDMFVSQAAKVAGAAVLLVFAVLMRKEIAGFTPVVDPSLAQDLSWIAVGFLGLWILAGLAVRREYIDAVRRHIRIGAERGETIIGREIDPRAVRLIIDAVDPRNVSSVMFALNAFDLLERKKLSPEVMRMIAEKAGEVRLTALNEMFGAEDASGHADAPAPPDPAAFVADLREILSSEAYQKLMGLWAEGVLKGGREAEADKMWLAKAISFMEPTTPLAECLPRLIGDDSADVSSLAIESAARLKRDDHIPAIVGMLGHPLIREDAINALGAYGPAAAPALAAGLADIGHRVELRQGIVEALARIGSPEAVGVLGRALGRGSGGLDTEIIDALDLIRSENESLPMPTDVALEKIRSLVHRYCSLFLDLRRCGPGERDKVRRTLLERELAGVAGNLFKLLGLSYSRRDINNAYRNLWTSNHGYAVELLDNVLGSEVKTLILPLIEDLDEEERARRFRRILRIVPES
jgi:ATP:ADP antiporter, AAA family